MTLGEGEMEIEKADTHQLFMPFLATLGISCMLASSAIYSTRPDPALLSTSTFLLHHVQRQQDRVTMLGRSNINQDRLSIEDATNRGE